MKRKGKTVSAFSRRRPFPPTSDLIRQQTCCKSSLTACFGYVRMGAPIPSGLLRRTFATDTYGLGVSRACESGLFIQFCPPSVKVG